MNDETVFEKVHDLNTFVILITRYYSYVFERLRRRYPRTKLNSWVESFVMSSELEGKGDLSLKRAIEEIMLEEGITNQDWVQLQHVRRIRNNLCHPSANVAKAQRALEERWNEHPSYGALKKMLNANITRTLSSPVIRTPIKSIPAGNWRDRPPRVEIAPEKKESKEKK